MLLNTGAEGYFQAGSLFLRTFHLYLCFFSKRHMNVSDLPRWLFLVCSPISQSAEVTVELTR